MKIQRFLESESVARWGTDDLHENQAGRLSTSQRRMLELRLYQFISVGTMMLGLVLLTVFIGSLVVVFSLQRDLGTMIANGYVIAGLIIPPWVVSVLGFDGLCLALDIRGGTVERDCGVVRLETHHQPPLFRKRRYVVVGKNRYLLHRGTHLREDETTCVYYAPHTRLIMAVEADDSR